MKVLFLSYEVAPLYKRGGLGDVAGSLPKALKKLGVDVRIGMPAYDVVTKSRFLPHTGEREAHKIPMYYAAGDEFTGLHLRKKDPDYGSVGFARFAQLILAATVRHDFIPDIIHCNDWHTGLVPFLIGKGEFAPLTRSKILLTIHNSKYQGDFPIAPVENNEKTAHIGELLRAETTAEQVSYLRLGIKYAHVVSTVSPHFAHEMRQGKADFGLRGLLVQKSKRIPAILNGIDYSVWNPATDKLISKNFTKRSVRTGKLADKLAVQKVFGMDQSDAPLFGMVARIVNQKGFDILVPILRDLAEMDVQVAILGSGFSQVEEAIKRQADKYDTIGFNHDFDEQLAHRIYAGSDFFLIPSVFEPCGLTQMIAMAYGTIPVAAHVGGLVDTITDGRTGFLFPRHGEANLLHAIKRASELYADRRAFAAMRSRCMRVDFSWNRSGRRYVKLYERVVNMKR